MYTDFSLYVVLATVITYIVALLMTGIMIYHIKSKYTAVGKIISCFFAKSQMLIDLVRLSNL